MQPAGEEHLQLLVTGGWDKNGNTLQDAWILDVNSGRWREVSDGNAHMNVRLVQLTESTVQTKSKLSCILYVKLTVFFVTNKSS